MQAWFSYASPADPACSSGCTPRVLTHVPARLPASSSRPPRCQPLLPSAAHPPLSLLPPGRGTPPQAPCWQTLLLRMPPWLGAIRRRGRAACPSSFFACSCRAFPTASAFCGELPAPSPQCLCYCLGCPPLLVPFVAPWSLLCAPCSATCAPLPVLLFSTLPSSSLSWFYHLCVLCVSWISLVSREAEPGLSFLLKHTGAMQQQRQHQRRAWCCLICQLGPACRECNLQKPCCCNPACTSKHCCRQRNLVLLGTGSGGGCAGWIVIVGEA